MADKAPEYSKFYNFFKLWKVFFQSFFYQFKMKGKNMNYKSPLRLAMENAMNGNHAFTRNNPEGSCETLLEKYIKKYY